MKTWILLRSAEVTNDDDGNDTNDDDHCLGIVSTLSCSVTSLASSCRPGSHRALYLQAIRPSPSSLPVTAAAAAEDTQLRWRNLGPAPPRPRQMGGPGAGGCSCAILELTSIFLGIHWSGVEQRFPRTQCVTSGYSLLSFSNWSSIIRICLYKQISLIAFTLWIVLNEGGG